MTSTIYKKLKSIQDAINYEIDQHYINAKGNKTTFSNFIIQNTKSIVSEINEQDKLKSLINLFYSYPTQDVTARMETVHRAQGILKEIAQNNKNIVRADFVGAGFKPAPTRDLKKTDVKYVKGVGPRISQILNKLMIFSVHDLFQYYPRTYIDYQKQVQIKDLKINEDVTIIGKIKSIGCFEPSKRKDLLIISINIQDKTGKIKINKFLSKKFGRIIESAHKKQYPAGTDVVCSGTVSFDKFSGSFTLTNANIEVLGKEGESLNTARIVPVYPLTEGISLEYMRKIISNAFNVYGNNIEESLPKNILQEEKLLDLKTSLTHIHFPESQEISNLARQRIVFEEFFKMQLELAYRRYVTDKNRSGLCLNDTSDGYIKKLLESLPFKLTNAQQRVFREIKADLMSNKPMHRLLQGDVGSGKTIVALMALVFGIENGFQTALMAPTEVLVKQHARKFHDYLKPLGLEACELTGSTPSRLKKEIYEGLRDGKIKIIVGTHALLQEEVCFQNLGLVIIDEQHRFGVKQRDDLLKKGKKVERLFMTATPIPRTLALALHGDLELSEIDELPKGRMPVKTILVQSSQRQKAFDLIKGEAAKGRQVYIVFPLIEESEALSAKAAEVEYEELSKTVFKDLRTGLMHGELPSRQKDKVMQDFVNKEIDILITTTVIEVGMDVQNATVMMIENAERFGLSQLHQLRGRIGRGSDQSYCLLVPQSYSDEALKRLEIMTKTNDGFIISQEDLKIRGPGEFLGTRQSGLPDLKLADLIKDTEVLEQARKKAIKILKEDPNLTNHPKLRNMVNVKQETYISAG